MNTYHHLNTYMDLVTERKRVGIEYNKACNLFMPLEVTNHLLERYQRIDRMIERMERQIIKQYKHETEMAQEISHLVIDGEILE